MNNLLTISYDLFIVFLSIFTSNYIAQFLARSFFTYYTCFKGIFYGFIILFFNGAECISREKNPRHCETMDIGRGAYGNVCGSDL